MSVCGVCAKKRSSFLMNNKLVCLACDELLFDIEIETEPEEQSTTRSERSPLQLPTKTKATSPSNA